MMKNIFSLVSMLLIMNSCSINKTIYVADSFANCESNESQKCIKIKEALEDDWTLLNGNIEGFEYKEGSTYKMEVKVTKIKDPVAGGSNLKYKLIKIIYEEISEPTQELSSFKGVWKVSKLTGIDNLSKSPTLIIDFDTKKVSGNAGCNSYGTDFSIEGDHLKFGIPNATKMMCTNIKIEKAFFSCLQNTSQYKLVDGELKFYAKDGEELLNLSSINK